MKMAVIWDIAPCSLVEARRLFIAIVLMIEKVRTSETSFYSNETTRGCISEGSNLK
jgi:hypothetical protein